MQGEIISFEIAKLAKEKGFKEECYHFYVKVDSGEVVKRSLEGGWENTQGLITIMW